MDLQDVQLIFNRALSKTFNMKKVMAIFTVLLLCGILVLFFRGVALHAGQWITLSMAFLPVFLCSGVILAAGIFLIRIYHDEVKKKEVKYRFIIGRSWEVMLGASYLSIPIILSYLLLWMFMGIFFLLNEIPTFGTFFGALLSFAPFLLNVGAIVLSFLSVSLWFFVGPIVALRGLNRVQLTQIITQRLKNDLFINLFLATVAAMPLLLVMGALIGAAAITEATCFICDTTTQTMIQWFFMMVPFAFILAPTVIFFFNFAAESHVLLQKTPRAYS